MTTTAKRLRIAARHDHSQGRMMNEAADLIEQQRREIEELSAHNNRYRIFVERFCEKVPDKPETHWIYPSVKTLKRATRFTPQTSLAERDRGVRARAVEEFQRWAMDFVCSIDYEPLKRKMFRKLNSGAQGQVVSPHNDPEYCGLIALFDKYANKTRNGKDGDQ